MCRWPWALPSFQPYLLRQFKQCRAVLVGSLVLLFPICSLFLRGGSSSLPYVQDTQGLLSPAYACMGGSESAVTEWPGDRLWQVHQALVQHIQCELVSVTCISFWPVIEHSCQTVH